MLKFCLIFFYSFLENSYTCAKFSVICNNHIYIPARKPKDWEIFWFLYNNLVSLYFSLDTVFIQTCHRVHSAFFLRFSFSTGIPTSSYFLAASNGGWEARRPDQARKFTRMGAGRLGGQIQLVWSSPLLLQEPGPKRVVGRPKGSYMGVFLPKWRWALSQELTDSAAQQGWCPRSAACNSWCIHHPAVCDGRMFTAATGAGRADGLIWLKNSPKQGLRGLAALSSWCILPTTPLPLLLYIYFYELI